MSTDLTISNAGPAQLPAHLQAAFAEQPSNIITGDRGANLGVKGKTFTITADGQSTPLMRRDQESGEEVARQVLPVVILDYGVKMGRAYYEGAYDPNETKGPTCYSLDSVVPEPEVEQKQSAKCADCPMAKKGSTITDSGKAATACGQHRILVVVPAAPAAMRQFPPLRLRIAQTSNYDGKSPDARAQGKFAFQNYLDSLKSRGIPNTRAVVTSLSFDSAAAYPKLFFRTQGWVSEEQHQLVEDFLAGDKVEEIMTWTGTIAAANGTNTRPEVIPTGHVVGEEDEEDDEVAAAKATLAKAATEKAAKAKGGKGKAKVEAAQHPADAALEKAGAKNPALAKDKAAEPAPSKLPGNFVSPPREEGEDEDDYTDRVTAARRAWKAAVQAEAAAKAATPAPAKAASAEFTFREPTPGEDEDDYAEARTKARRAWKAAQAAPAAAPAAPKPFVAPVQEEGEDEDDYADRVTAARRAHKAAGGAAPAKAAVVAEPVPKSQEKPAEKFLPEAAALDAIGGDDEEEAAPKATAPAKASKGGKATTKAPPEAKPIEVPGNVAALLDTWDE